MAPSGERSVELPSLNFKSIKLAAYNTKWGTRPLSAMVCIRGGKSLYAPAFFKPKRMCGVEL